MRHILIKRDNFYNQILISKIRHAQGRLEKNLVQTKKSRDLELSNYDGRVRVKVIATIFMRIILIMFTLLNFVITWL